MNMKPKEVCNWLRDNVRQNLPQKLRAEVEAYCEGIIEYEVDGKTLSDFSMDDFKDIGIGHAVARSKIYHAWQDLVKPAESGEPLDPSPTTLTPQLETDVPPKLPTPLSTSEIGMADAIVDNVVADKTSLVWELDFTRKIDEEEVMRGSEFNITETFGT